MQEKVSEQSLESLEQGLQDLSTKLQRTLNTVLAEAMAKELANGDCTRSSHRMHCQPAEPI